MNRTTGAFMKTALFMLALLWGYSIQAAEQPGPKNKVEDTVNTIIGILGDNSISWEQRRTRIKELADTLFDYRAMSQVVLSTNWRQANSEQREEFQRLFSRLLENTYIDRLRAYSGETVQFRDEEITDDRARVRTVIMADTGTIPVNYRLRRRSDGWFVYDVEVDSISLVTSYRETYRSIVNRSGMEGLLRRLRERIEQLEQGEA